MNRPDVLGILSLVLLGCGDSEGGGASTGGGQGDAGANGVSSTSVATTGGDSDGGGGSHLDSASSGATTGSGGAAATAEQCFAYHDETSCMDAGCALFYPADVFTIVDGVCEADDSEGFCFALEDELVSPALTAVLREFAADGPMVLGLGAYYSLVGWRGCTDADVATSPECCCYGGMGDGCRGITPILPD